MIRHTMIGRAPRRSSGGSRPPFGCRLTSRWRCLPDFLIIGAQKSGTTSLAAWLSEHPAVWIPPRKECHYLSAPERPVRDYRACFMTRWTRRRIERRIRRPLLLGDATPYDLFHPRASKRAATVIPKARIIVILRDPVERAWSHHQHAVRLGFETLPFDEALDAEEERLRDAEELLLRDPTASHAPHQHLSYVARGHYARQLHSWLGCFTRTRIHIEIAERVFRRPGDAVRRIEQFLGVEAGPVRAFEVHNRGEHVAEMSPETRRRLQAEFAASNRELESMLGESLPWD